MQLGQVAVVKSKVSFFMLDVFIGGEIFTAPGVKATLDGVKLADRGNGVLLIVLNHAGDMLTGKQVLAECHKQGMKNIFTTFNTGHI